MCEKGNVFSNVMVCCQGAKDVMCTLYKWSPAHALALSISLIRVATP